MAIISGVILATMSWYAVKFRVTVPKVYRTVYQAIFYNHTATIAWASVALVFVIGSNVRVQPGGMKLKDSKNKGELHVSRSLGKYLAGHFSEVAARKTEVLIIDRVNESIRMEHHKAFVAGFEAGITKNITKVSVAKIPLANNAAGADANTIADASEITANLFDEILAEYPDTNMVVSLVGLPTNYEGSKLWGRVARGESLIAVVTDDVYLHGEMLVNGEISAFVVPKPVSEYTSFTGAESYETVFDSRYSFIDADNLILKIKKNRILFKMSKVF